MNSLFLSLILPLEFLLVAGDFLVGLTELESRQVGVVEKDVVLAIDLVDDQIGYDVVVVTAAVAKARLGVELGDLIGGALHVAGADSESL